MKRYVNFRTNIKNFDKLFFGFHESITIESMIKTFLKSNNSTIPFSIEYLSIIYNSRLINDEKYLHKKLSTLFTNPSKIYFIKVFTCGDILAASYGMTTNNKNNCIIL